MIMHQKTVDMMCLAIWYHIGDINTSMQCQFSLELAKKVLNCLNTTLLWWWCSWEREINANAPPIGWGGCVRISFALREISKKSFSCCTREVVRWRCCLWLWKARRHHLLCFELGRWLLSWKLKHLHKPFSFAFAFEEDFFFLKGQATPIAEGGIANRVCLW